MRVRAQATAELIPLCLLLSTSAALRFWAAAAPPAGTTRRACRRQATKARAAAAAAASSASALPCSVLLSLRAAPPPLVLNAPLVKPSRPPATSQPFLASPPRVFSPQMSSIARTSRRQTSPVGSLRHQPGKCVPGVQAAGGRPARTCRRSARLHWLRARRQVVLLLLPRHCCTHCSTTGPVRAPCHTHRSTPCLARWLAFSGPGRRRPTTWAQRSPQRWR